MTFLPIVERELRVAARRQVTFWARQGAALIAIVAAGAILGINLPSGAAPASVGKGLFATLTWMLMAVILPAGPFLTSDCLSEEKRQGTLGLLFLTDLRSYDVVLGKLVASSLRGSSAILAVIPILAMSLILGGITGAQFWKSALALLSALWMSLSAGLFVSALSRDSQKALALTILLLLLLVAGAPLGDSLLAGFSGRPWQPVLSMASPVYLFMQADAWGVTPFWPALFFNQLVAWSFLITSALVVPRIWQDRPDKASTRVDSKEQRPRYGDAQQRAELRRKLMDRNPVLWLVAREQWQARALWVAVATMLVGFVGCLATFGSADLVAAGFSSLSGVLNFIFYLAVASEGCRFLLEARRNGLLEVILATPLSVGQVITGQWLAIVRRLGPPLLVWLALQFTASALTQRAAMRSSLTVPASASSTRPTAPGSNFTASASITTTIRITTAYQGPPAVPTLLGSLVAFADVVRTLTSWIALFWFGMWMGLSSKAAGLATLKTILFVQILPGIGLAFATGLIVSLTALAGALNTSSFPIGAVSQLAVGVMTTILA
ncbi:MAG TPA: hypothetical protein VNH84_09050, partial [Candidatus Saccharimonadales bacterium]|nr:hypothetical protein [Candidatus Saccharimonadales bacterium]